MMNCHILFRHVLIVTAFAVATCAVSSAQAANGTAYYFDVNGTTAGFGSPAGSYNQNGGLWSTSSAGTAGTAAIPADAQLTFGNLATDFSGNTFTVNMNSNRWNGLLINCNNANVTLSGTANAYLNADQTWTVAAGSTLNQSQNWNAGGLNMNNKNVGLLGGGTINFTTGIGYNSDKTVTQNMAGGTVNLSGAAVGTQGGDKQASYTLTQGNLNFASAASANAFNRMRSAESAKFNINGGVINNTSGAPLTLDLYQGTYTFGGNFAFTGSNDLNLGTAAVALTAASQVTVNNNTLTIGGPISGGPGLTKAGAGTLAVNGNYTAGAVNVNNGVLLVNSTSGDGFNPSSKTITVNNGGTLRFGNSNKIQNNVLITVNGSGLFDMNGFGDVVGQLAGAGNINLNAALLLDGYSNASTQNFSGDISGNGSLTLRSITGTQILSGTNSYSGGTTIDNGTLRINSPASLPTTGTTTINAAGTLEVVSGGDNTYSQILSGSGRVVLDLSGGTSNTYLTGASSGFNGTLEINNTGGNKLNTSGMNIGATALIEINSGGQLFVHNNNLANPIEMIGTGNTENRGAIRLAGATLSGPISVMGNATIGISGAGTLTGTISTGVAGTSTLRIGAPNEYAPAASSFQGIFSDGVGTLALSIFNDNSGNNFIPGSSLNTYSGGTTLLHGPGNGTRLIIGAISGTPYGSGPITIGQAATNRAGIYMNTASQTLANDVVFNTRLGSDRPGIRTDALNITLSGDVTANLADATFSTNGTGSFNLTGQVTGAQGLRLHNQFGSSITVTLNNAAMNNNYQGDTTIEGTKGTLILGAANQIPNGAGAGNLVNDGTFNMNGFSDTINGLSGGGGVNGGSGTPILTIGDNNASSTFTGTINDAGGTLSVIKTGTGDTIFSGNHTYSGGTQIDAGRLRLQTNASASLGSGNVTVASGGQLFVATAATLNNVFSISGDGDNGLDTQPRGALRLEANSVISGSGSVTLVGDASIGAYSNGTGTVNAPIGGNFDLTINKSSFSSPGTIRFGGNNSYSGTTTVANGTLALQHASSNNIASSPLVQIGTGATLDVTGLAGGVWATSASQVLSGTGGVLGTVGGAGLVSPGNSPGILTATATDPSGGLDYAFEFTATGGPDYANAGASINDVLRLTHASDPFSGGTFTAGNTIDVYLAVSGVAMHDEFRGGFFTDRDSDFLATVAGADFQFWILGDGAGNDATFNSQGFYSLTDFTGSSILVGTSQVATANFAGGPINNGWVMQFTVVPEPETFVLGAFGVLAITVLVWRRKKNPPAAG